jgi:beta-galactosidase
VLGKGFHESCFEDPFTDDVDTSRERAPTLVAESFLRAFERALLARGVPFAYAAGESLTESTHGASWVVCATAGGLKADVFGQLRARVQKGCVVTIGPEVPTRDGSFRALSKPHDVTGLELETLADEARADALVARRIEELKLPTYPVDPDEIQVSVLEDEQGRARLVFVMNPLPSTTTGRMSLGAAQHLDEVFPGDGVLIRSGGAFDVAVAGRSVRIFAVR